MAAESANITAENTGTSALHCYHGGSLATVSVSGTFTATIHLQRSFDAGSSWLDLESYTVATEKNVEIVEPQHIRLFCKSGNFVRGTAICRVGRN